jgi:hypothetical protein
MIVAPRFSFLKKTQERFDGHQVDERVIAYSVAIREIRAIAVEQFAAELRARSLASLVMTAARHQSNGLFFRQVERESHPRIPLRFVRSVRSPSSRSRQN